MYLPLGTFSPKVKLGVVSASRNCFPRALSEKRTQALLKECSKADVKMFVPKGQCRIIESKQHAAEAAAQIRAAGCDAAVLYLGNFSPEIEDACFVKDVGLDVMIIAAAEESASSLACDRGDALCGMLSAVLAVRKRGLLPRVHIPQHPIVDAARGAQAIARFERIMKVVKGARKMTIGMFGPRPRDFETCNYNLASIGSLGVEVEEIGFFDLVNEIRRVEQEENVMRIVAAMKKEMAGKMPGDFVKRLAVFEKALLNFRSQLKLSGATTQCWSEQEFALKHVPCYINARLAAQGFPVACENDAYSLIAELLGQYASSGSVTVLDLNHSIPKNLGTSLAPYPPADLVGLFHCGNTDPRRMKKPEMRHQVIMKRLMEPGGAPDITRGTIEGQIKASPLTLVQIHGAGDGMRAYLAEGSFLDLDPRTFGATGTAHIPGFGRFYRHALLGRFHHHTAVAFDHCAGVLFDALKLLGVSEILTPLPKGIAYPGENPFEVGITAAWQPL